MIKALAARDVVDVRVAQFPIHGTVAQALFALGLYVIFAIAFAWLQPARQRDGRRGACTHPRR